MVTGDQVREACLEAGITRVNHHDCSLCGYMTHYSIENGRLFFNPGCHCTGSSGPEYRSWDDAADWINMQTADVHKERIAKAFGLELAHGPQREE